MEGVELEFEPEALSAVARRAVERKTGARGLRSIMESVLLDAMFEIPSEKDVEKIIVTREAVEKKVPLTIIRKRA